MKKLIILPLLFLTVITYCQIDTIQNNENGLSVRTKLNQTILTVNSLSGGSPSGDSTYLEIFTDKVSELTAGSGVTIDGLTLVKDNQVTLNTNYSALYFTSDADEFSWYNSTTELLEVKATGIGIPTLLWPMTTTVDLGSSTYPFRNGFINYLQMQEKSTPSTPAANTGILWMNSADEHVYWITSTTTYDLTEGTGGGVDTTNLSNRIDANAADIQDIWDEINDTVPGENSVVMRDDIQTIGWFGGGNRTSGATTSFTTDAFYGSFKNSTNDTLVVTRMDCILEGSSPSVGVQIYWNTDHGNSGTATTLNSAPLTITSTTTGDVDQSFSNFEIPPGVWVWCQTPTVTTAPTYMSITLSGYKK